MTNRVSRFRLFYEISGIVGVIKHLASRLIPPSRFVRQATILDFKRCGLKFADDVWDLLSSIGVELTRDEIKSIQLEFDAFTGLQRIQIPDEPFPHNWNSGESLRLLLFAFVRVRTPLSVVETGTANGYSTSAIAHALEINGKGNVHTYDILETSAPYVLPSSRSHVKMHHIAEHPNKLFTAMKSQNLDTLNGFYFHDADHSYFGQYNDFEIARKLGFKYYISDDVETSLVFCEKALKNFSAILFDGRKFIGVTLIAAY